ncbi:MAG: hypothetical protein LBL96_07005 [Clostridiales bacterium]|jgi:hypothetical protein|nr:hypothetical protein [Clostridiales bacterium]
MKSIFDAVKGVGVRVTKEVGSLIKGKETHVFYITELYKCMSACPSASYAAYVAGRLKRLLAYVSDDKWLDDVYSLDDGKRQAADFLSLCVSVFSIDAITKVCDQMAAQPHNIDGKEFLFFAEQALTEVKRYFFRHCKRLTDLYTKCGYSYQQANEKLLPLAASLVIAQNENTIFALPFTYRDANIERLPELPEYSEPAPDAVLSYLPRPIAEGLLSMGHQSFYQANARFFSVFLADEELWLASFTNAPENDGPAKAALVNLARSHCERAEIKSFVDDPKMVNNWLTFEEKERLKREMVNGIKEEAVVINHNDSDGEIKSTIIDGLNYKRRVKDLPSWVARFHASALTFRLWKPQGYVTIGVNLITEYRDIALLQKAVMEEIDGKDAEAKLFELAQYISKISDTEAFESHIKERLQEFAVLMRYVYGKKIGARFEEYFRLQVEPFLRKHSYMALIPESRVGDTYTGSVYYAYSEPATECHVPCNTVETKMTRAFAENNAGPVVAAITPGFMRGGNVIVQPTLTIAMPISVFDHLTALVGKMEEEKRGDVDFLGGRVSLTQFVQYSKKLEMFARQKDLTHKQKCDFFTQNHFYYTLFNTTPEMAFEKAAIALGAQADAYKNSFVKAWGVNLERLKDLGISETIIVPGSTIVTHSQLMDGWKKENKEKRKADAEHPADLVYEVIQKGIEVEGVPIQCPIVNVYAK